MDDGRQRSVNNDVWVIISEYEVVICGGCVASICNKDHHYWVRCNFEVKFFRYLDRSVSNQFIYVKHWSNYLQRKIPRYCNISEILNSHRHIIATLSDLKPSLFRTKAPLIPYRTLFKESISLKALNTRIDSDSSLSLDTLLKVQSDTSSEWVHLCDINPGTSGVNPHPPHAFHAR